MQTRDAIGPTPYNIAAQWGCENDRLEFLIGQLQGLTVFRFDHENSEAVWWTLMNRLIGRLMEVQRSLAYGQSLLAESADQGGGSR